MKKNVASQIIGAEMVSASDGSAFTSTVTVYVTGDNGTQAIGSVGSGVCTHKGNGYHSYVPAQAETNYDHIAFTFIGTGAVPQTVQLYTEFPQSGDAFARLGAPAGASISADIANVLPVIRTGTAQAGSSGTITLDSGASSSDNFYNGMTLHIVSGTGAGQARMITDYIGSTKVASLGSSSGGTQLVTAASSDSVFKIYPVGPAQVEMWHNITPNVASAGRIPVILDASGLQTDAVTEIVDGVWDKARSGNVTAGTFGEALQVLANGTAQSGSSNVAVLAAGASSVDDLYNGCIMQIVAGTGAGQSRLIYDYNGTSKQVTISQNWLVSLSTDSRYVIRPYGQVDVETWRYSPPLALNFGYVQADTQALDGSVSAAANIADAFDGTGGVTISANLAGSITSVTNRIGLKKNTALNNFTFGMTDDTNHAPATGLTVTAERSLDGAAFAACANAVSEVGSGAYKLNLATTDVNADNVTFKFTATGADDLLITVVTQA